MSQEQKQQMRDLIDNLNPNVSSAAELSTWSMSNLDLLMLHTLQCSGCHLFCRTMTRYWAHRELHDDLGQSDADCENCRKVDGLFRYHVRNCKNVACPLIDCEVAKITRHMGKAKDKQQELPALQHAGSECE